MAKDSFILYNDQKEVFDSLSDEDAGRLIKAIFKYQFNENVELDGMLKIAFIPIKQLLDRNKEKYEKVVERNKKNIENRWNDDTKNTSGKIGIKKNTKNTDSDNDSDNDIIVTDNNASDSCVDGLQDVIDFYDNNIGILTPYGLQVIDGYVQEMGKDVVIYAMKISVEADKRTIQYIKAILNNWSKKGIKTLVEAQKECKIKPKREDNMEFNKSQNNWDDLYDN